MKKIKFISMFVLLIVSATMLFSGCNLLGKLTEEEAKEALFQAIANSIDEKIYYWQELDNRNKNVIETRFNVYGEKTIDGDIVYDGDIPKGYGATFKTSYDSVVYESCCGMSNAGKDTALNVLFTKYSDKNNKDTNYARYTKMSVEEYLASESMQKYLLANKLRDLSLLKTEDIYFEGDYNTATKRVKLISLKFKIRDEFFTRFYEQYGEDSVLKGVGVSVEIAYGNISTFTTYKTVKLDEKMSIDNECYRFDIAYIGPIVKPYDYLQKDDKGNYVWEEV